MFEGWENYYLMVGSSAGALIGLMFVVVTLTAGRDRAEVDRGKHLYTSPIVWHLSVILALSGAAAVPGVSARFFGFTTMGLAVLGFAWGSGCGHRMVGGSPPDLESSGKLHDAPMRDNSVRLGDGNHARRL